MDAHGEDVRYAGADVVCLVLREARPKEVDELHGQHAEQVRDLRYRLGHVRFIVLQGIGEESNASEPLSVDGRKVHRLAAMNLERLGKPAHLDVFTRLRDHDGEFPVASIADNRRWNK
jgi:hypothetical protein